MFFKKTNYRSTTVPRPDLIQKMQTETAGTLSQQDLRRIVAEMLG